MIATKGTEDLSKYLKSLLEMLKQVLSSWDGDWEPSFDGVGALIRLSHRVPLSESKVGLRFYFSLKTNEKTDERHGDGIFEFIVENILEDGNLCAAYINTQQRPALKFFFEFLQREIIVALSAEANDLWLFVGPNGKHLHSWNGIFDLGYDSKRPWRTERLVEAYNKLEAVDLFKLQFHPLWGVPLISETINREMGGRFWWPDACAGKGTLRERYPYEWIHLSNLMVAFCCSNPVTEKIIEAIKDPKWYRNYGVHHGMPYLFLIEDRHGEGPVILKRLKDDFPDPISFTLDKGWGNHKRLGAAAEMLAAIVENLFAGSLRDDVRGDFDAETKCWGINWKILGDDGKKYYLDAIRNIAAFLMSVQWNGERYDMRAPSCSDWEERMLKGGCASDIGNIECAFTLLKRLLFDPSLGENATIKAIRTYLLSVDHMIGNESFLVLLSQFQYADFRDETRLDNYIQAAKRFLAERVIGPIVKSADLLAIPAVNGVRHSDDRHLDLSLAMLAANYNIRFDNQGARNAYVRFRLCKLVHDELAPMRSDAWLGYMRYGLHEVVDEEDNPRIICDSYLGLLFNSGLMAPELARYLVAAYVDNQYEHLQDNVEDRAKIGTLSLRDHLLIDLHKRLVKRGGGAILARKDALTVLDQVHRQQFQVPEATALWSIGPTAVLGALAQAKKDLLEEIDTGGLDKYRQSLLGHINELIEEVLVLSLRILVAKFDKSGKPILKADGTGFSSEINMPEAFQAIFNSRGELVWRPGQHTLMWSLCQLEYALRKLIEVARQEDTLAIKCPNLR